MAFTGTRLPVLDARTIAGCFSADRLELFLLPTERCNFRCTYCYEDFALPRMPGRVVRAVKALLDARSDSLSHLRIQWFGGEPLAALDVVRDIGGHARSLSRGPSGPRLAGVMTTNGYGLAPEVLEELTGLGITTFQVSLDGPRELHDRVRVRADGRGTFDRIWRNLKAARETRLDFRMVLRLHLTPENLPVMEGFLETVREEFLVDPRFVPHFVPIGYLGGPNDHRFAVLSTEESAGAAARLSADAGTRSKAEVPNVCYASKPNSLIVRANGRIAKCTVALGDPRNDIGRIEEDGTLVLDDERMRIWLMGWPGLSLPKLRCPLEFLPELAPMPEAPALGATVTPGA